MGRRQAVVNGRRQATFVGRRRQASINGRRQATLVGRRQATLVGRRQAVVNGRRKATLVGRGQAKLGGLDRTAIRGATATAGVLTQAHATGIPLTGAAGRLDLAHTLFTNAAAAGPQGAGLAPRALATIRRAAGAILRLGLLTVVVPTDRGPVASLGENGQTGIVERRQPSLGVLGRAAIGGTAAATAGLAQVHAVLIPLGGAAGEVELADARFAFAVEAAPNRADIAPGALAAIQGAAGAILPRFTDVVAANGQELPRRPPDLAGLHRLDPQEAGRCDLQALAYLGDPALLPPQLRDAGRAQR